MNQRSWNKSNMYRPAWMLPRITLRCCPKQIEKFIRTAKNVVKQPTGCFGDAPGLELNEWTIDKLNIKVLKIPRNPKWNPALVVPYFRLYSATLAKRHSLTETDALATFFTRIISLKRRARSSGPGFCFSDVRWAVPWRDQGKTLSMLKNEPQFQIQSLGTKNNTQGLIERFMGGVRGVVYPQILERCQHLAKLIIRCDIFRSEDALSWSTRREHGHCLGLSFHWIYLTKNHWEVQHQVTCSAM